MDAIKLAEEIIGGRRITREDDLSFFLNCDLDELCKGADMIREKFVGDKVDLCSIISRLIITRIVRSMISFLRRRSLKRVR